MAAQVDISTELLELLRSVNQKLEDGSLATRSGGGKQGKSVVQGDARESVGGDKDTSNREEHTPQSPASEDGETAPFEWWKHTHRGQDWISDIPLPDSGPESPASEAESDVPDAAADKASYDLVSKYAPEDMTWGYRYESSFWRRAKELSFMADTVSRKTSQAWAIPEDGRSGLTLSLRGLGLEGLPYRGGGVQHDSSSPATKDKVLTTIERLSDFDKKLHRSPNRSFSVIDFDPWNGAFAQLDFGNNVKKLSDWQWGPGMFDCDVLPNCWREMEWDDQNHPVMLAERSWDRKELFYPLCSHTARSTVQKRINSVAPWRRLIIVQGIASISHKASEGIGLPGCPYFDPYARSSSFRDAVKIHLLGHNTSGNASLNPYKGNYPFHITFYERLNHFVDERDKSQWPIGELFSAEPGGNHAKFRLLIRRSSFTVATISFSYYLTNIHYTYLQALQNPFYTVLLLLPEGFMRSRESRESSLSYHLCGRAFSAELGYIVFGLGEVIDRWIALEEYIGNLLVEDFMDPSEYSALLFDDESFSRSRKYFWVIGSLNEFISSISDNIKQWDLYCQARVEPFLENPHYEKDIQAASLIRGGNDKDLKLIKDRAKTGANCRETLANIKSQFEKRLETVKALRDGLFNASALVESRAATRLGENVKLLTYVSIFYLPLAFCASLLAVPNIDSRSTRTPFIITTIIIKFITYTIIFNLNTVTHQIGKIYQGGREALVKDMQAQQGWWGETGQLFQEFTPKDQKGTPSEWLVLVYAVRKLLWRKEAENDAEVIEKTEGHEGLEADAESENTTEGSVQTPGAEKVKSLGLFSRLRGRSKMKQAVEV